MYPTLKNQPLKLHSEKSMQADIYAFKSNPIFSYTLGVHVFF